MSDLPCDLDAERAVLGCLMLGGAADGLTSADFYRPAHQVIYEAIVALRGTGKPAETIAVADELRRRNQLARMGGGPYLHTCLTAAPSAANAAYYAGIVREHAERRQLLERADRLRQAALNPGADLADVRALAAAPVTATADVLPKVLRLADVEPERIEWLWPGYLPLGKVVVIDGDPGVGKSTVCLDIAARVSTGSPMPDGSPGAKGVVMVLSAEDGLADTIRPRLDAAQADAARVITVTQIGEGPDARPVSIPGDLPAIDAIIGAHGVRLVIVDVLMAYLAGDVNAHRDQDIRRALHVLSGVAERRGCCVLTLRHLNKSGGGNALYRGGGSIGIIGAARAGFMCGRDPDDETGARRIFANVKMNIAAEPPSLAYRLVYDELHDVGRVDWLGSSEHRAADLLSEPGDQEDRTERDAAADWLTGYLTDLGGEAEARDVKKAARAAGFAERTLTRARGKTGVTTGRSGFGKGAVYVWRLDPCRPHAGHAGQGSEAGLHGQHGGQHGEDAWPEDSTGAAAQQ